MRFPNREQEKMYLKDSIMLKGIVVDVYKDASRSVGHHGISDFSDQALLVGNGIPRITQAENLPIIEIRTKEFRGESYIYATPILSTHEFIGSGKFGGSFIWSSAISDISEQPIKLYDHFESFCNLDSRYHHITSASKGKNYFSYHVLEDAVRFNKANQLLNLAIKKTATMLNTNDLIEALGFLIADFHDDDADIVLDILERALIECNYPYLVRAVRNVAALKKKVEKEIPQS